MARTEKVLSTFRGFLERRVSLCLFAFTVQNVRQCPTESMKGNAQNLKGEGGITL